MAARDDTYRNQARLHMIFALSCFALVASMFWMFWKDHNREYKQYQEKAFAVEEAMLRRQVYALKEKNRDLLDKETANYKNLKARFDNNATVKKLQAEIDERRPRFVQLQTKLSSDKATYGELGSRRDILVQQKKPAEEIAQAEQALKQAGEALDRLERDFQEVESEINARETQIKQERAELTAADARIKKLTSEQTRLEKLADDKHFGAGARVRAWPILDAFNSPYKIVQHIPEHATINYNFKDVQRVDRCATCHVFIDRQGFDKQTLRELGEDPPFEDLSKQDRAKMLLKLSAAEVSVFANHPRLDLFLSSTSPHSVEKFGCTLCHSGHGGSATFNFAYHFPDSGKTDGDKDESYEAKKKRWEGTYHWHESLHPDYLWDHPMKPSRFTESTCVKCHHEVLDLIRSDGREEAPKLLKGYRLVRDNGCFGCHEIAGWKAGKEVGPDLRLEPYPALDELTPFERSKLANDPTDPPGTQRKVGPSLRRIADKTHGDWTERWIRSPRGFRPETRMPHFFGLANNTPGRLSDSLSGDSQLPHDQVKFPDTEIAAMSFYLFKESESYLSALRKVQEVKKSGGDATARDENEQVRFHISQLQSLRRDLTDDKKAIEVAKLTLAVLRPAILGDELSDEQRKLLSPIVGDASARLTLRQRHDLADKMSKEQLNVSLWELNERQRLWTAAASLDARPNLDKTPELKVKEGDKEVVYAGKAENGAKLFREKGCVACHNHPKAQEYSDSGEPLSKAVFGPDLSRLKDKLGNDKVKAEKWLYYWLEDPRNYSPRTLMPKPHLATSYDVAKDPNAEAKNRLDLTLWLLTPEQGYQPPPAAKDAWKSVEVSKPDKSALDDLALKVYLEKVFMKTKAADVVKNGLKPTDPEAINLRPDADERVLISAPEDGKGGRFADSSERLRYYVGKKSVGRYGCYACHDIPGFETAKPIGTPLNEWGKKDAERLAFDNIRDFLKEHHKGYDPFFADAVEHGRRDGFLYQKLKEPRSYDYAKYKSRPWEDRLKMPQFKFSHPVQRENEKQADFDRRAALEEQEGAEAVMTFVLGLVGEPLHPSFVNKPRTDRLNEVKGYKVLEKHNCIGCHTVKPGNYEFAFDQMRMDPKNQWKRDPKEPGRVRDTMLDYLKDQLSQASNIENLLTDHAFPEHTAWQAPNRNPIPGRTMVRGRPTRIESNAVILETYEAIALPTLDGPPRYLPAGLTPLRVPLAAGFQKQPPMGGAYAEYVAKLVADSPSDPPNYKKAAHPPFLMREGQKVQAPWLAGFLRHPHEIRPTVAARLRMPQFHLSPEEIETLVNYFIAADRIEDPGLGLEYLSEEPPDRSAEARARLTAPLVLKPKRLLGSGDGPISMARAPASEPLPEPGVTANTQQMGMRYLSDRLKCLQCHSAGPLRTQGKADELGPDLTSVSGRLRPEFIQRWVTTPSRLVPYAVMSQYFKESEKKVDYEILVNGYVSSVAALKHPFVRPLPPFDVGGTPAFFVGVSAYNYPRPVEEYLRKAYEDQRYQLAFDLSFTPQQKIEAIRATLYQLTAPANGHAHGAAVGPPGDAKP